MEIEFERLGVLRAAGLGFLASIGLALFVGLGSWRLGLVRDPLLIAIILLATSLGLVIPVLRDAGQIATPFGQLVVAAASIADFGAVILLSLLFSETSTSVAGKVVLLAGFASVAIAVVFAVMRVERSMRLTAVLLRLQDTTAQIRVRGALLLLMALVALARQLGLEVILAAFLAGAVLRLVDRDELATHPHFKTKLDGMGFGFFIPVFFVASGIQFKLGALFANVSTLAHVPLFLAGLLAVRGLPALVYRPLLQNRQIAAAGLLQATSLPFVVAASQIGTQVGLLTPANGAALVTAGLVSVLAFPLLALTILRGSAERNREGLLLGQPDAGRAPGVEVDRVVALHDPQDNALAPRAAENQPRRPGES